MAWSSRPDPVCAVPVDLELLGVACRVICPAPAVAAEVRRLWGTFVVSSAHPPGGVVDVVGPVRRTGTPGDLLAEVAMELNRATLGGTAHLATHAATVEIGGGTVAFPAASGTGKSTLTVALVQRGAGYLSDEALCLDRTDGRVKGYPRPIGLSRWSAEELGVGWPPTASPVAWSADGPEVLVAAQDIGGTTPPAAPPLRHVVLLQRTVEAARPVLTPAPRSDGVAALLTRSFNHWRDRRSSVAVVTTAVAGSQVWTLQLGPPRETAELVLDVLSTV